MPLIGSIVPIRNKLVYPAGIAPGFDPTHPAAPTCLISAISNGITLLNLVNSKKSAFSGSPTKSINAFIGPAVNTVASTANTFTYPTTVFTAWTLAAIFVPSNVTTLYNIMQASSASNNQTLTLSTGGVLQMSYGGTSHSSGFSTLSIGVPYFAVASAANALPINFALTNLATGSIKTIAVANASTATASNGTFGMPASGTQSFEGGLAAAMANNSYLSLAQVQAWAADPWAFWYPQRPPFWVGTAAVVASSFLAAWAMNKNRIDRIVP